MMMVWLIILLLEDCVAVTDPIKVVGFDSHTNDNFITEAVISYTSLGASPRITPITRLSFYTDHGSPTAPIQIFNRIQIPDSRCYSVSISPLTSTGSSLVTVVCLEGLFASGSIHIYSFTNGSYLGRIDATSRVAVHSTPELKFSAFYPQLNETFINGCGHCQFGSKIVTTYINQQFKIFTECIAPLYSTMACLISLGVEPGYKITFLSAVEIPFPNVSNSFSSVIASITRPTTILSTDVMWVISTCNYLATDSVSNVLAVYSLHGDLTGSTIIANYSNPIHGPCEMQLDCHVFPDGQFLIAVSFPVASTFFEIGGVQLVSFYQNDSLPWEIGEMYYLDFQPSNVASQDYVLVLNGDLQNCSIVQVFSIAQEGRKFTLLPQELTSPKPCSVNFQPGIFEENTTVYMSDYVSILSNPSRISRDYRNWSLVTAALSVYENAYVVGKTKFCPAGRQYWRGSCRPCPIGTYKFLMSNFTADLGTCVPCPPSTLNVEIGATNISSCNSTTFNVPCGARKNIPTNFSTVTYRSFPFSVPTATNFAIYFYTEYTALVVGGIILFAIIWVVIEHLSDSEKMRSRRINCCPEPQQDSNKLVMVQAHEKGEYVALTLTKFFVTIFGVYIIVLVVLYYNNNNIQCSLEVVPQASLVNLPFDFEQLRNQPVEINITVLGSNFACNINSCEISHPFNTTFYVLEKDDCTISIFVEGLKLVPPTLTIKFTELDENLYIQELRYSVSTIPYQEVQGYASITGRVDFPPSELLRGDQHIFLEYMLNPRVDFENDIFSGDPKQSIPIYRESTSIFELTALYPSSAPSHNYNLPASTSVRISLSPSQLVYYESCLINGYSILYITTEFCSLGVTMSAIAFFFSYLFGFFFAGCYEYPKLRKQKEGYSAIGST